MRNKLALLNAFACVAHVLSGSLGLALHERTKVDVYQPLFEYVKGGNLAFRQIPHTVFRIGILLPYVIVEYITAVFHIIYTSQLLVPSFARWMRRNVADTPSLNPTRWVEYGITASFLSAFGGNAIGLNQFPYFFKVLVDGFALQLIGYSLELLDCTVSLHVRLQKILWNIGTLLNVSSVGILLYQLFASKAHTDIFYYNVVPFTIWYNTFGVIAKLDFYKWRQFADPYFTEKWYIILSLSTKISVFWLSFATYRQISEENGQSKSAGVDWFAVRMCASWLLFGLIAIVAVYDWHSFKPRRRRLRIERIEL